MAVPSLLTMTFFPNYGRTETFPPHEPIFIPNNTPLQLFMRLKTEAMEILHLRCPLWVDNFMVV